MCACGILANSYSILFVYCMQYKANGNMSDFSDDDDDDDDDFDDDYDGGGALLSMDETTISAEESSLTGSTQDWNVNGLSQFVFLNPRWLVAAVACILRHDLDREIQETRRSLNNEERTLSFSPTFYDAHLNCPVITARDAKMLWQAKKITKKAADRASKASSNMTVTPFEFLILLLIRFGVFVPIDLSIEKAFLGGKDYAGHEDESADTFPLQKTFYGTHRPPTLLLQQATLLCRPNSSFCPVSWALANQQRLGPTKIPSLGRSL